MKKNFLILAALMTATAIYTVVETRYASPEKQTHESAGAAVIGKATAFTYKDITGKLRTSDEFQGKPIVLNFWASWCAPCIIEFPQMVKLAAAEADTIFLFLSWDEKGDDAKRFLQKYGKNLPDNVVIGFDNDRSIGADYGTRQIPETYLVDAMGQIRGKVIGADVDWTGPVIRRKVSLLNQP